MRIRKYKHMPQAESAYRTVMPLIGEIEAAVTEARMDDEWRHDYMTYQIHQRDAELRGERRGETRGIAIGEKRGENRNKRESARRMLIMGIDKVTISKALDMPIDEIERLAGSNADA